MSEQNQKNSFNPAFNLSTFKHIACIHLNVELAALLSGVLAERRADIEADGDRVETCLYQLEQQLNRVATNYETVQIPTSTEAREAA